MRRALIATIATIATAVAAGAGDDQPRLDFSLEDQFGVTHTDEDCRGAVTLLLGGGRKGSRYIDQWGSALHRAIAEELAAPDLCWVGFAHLKGAPFFVKKKIIDSFPRDPEAWTLLDWKGLIAKNWGAEKDAANLYLFDRNGRLLHVESLRDFDRAQLARVVRMIRTAVD